MNEPMVPLPSTRAVVGSATTRWWGGRRMSYADREIVAEVVRAERMVEGANALGEFAMAGLNELDEFRQKLAGRNPGFEGGLIELEATTFATVTGIVRNLYKPWSG